MSNRSVSPRTAAETQYALKFKGLGMNKTQNNLGGLIRRLGGNRYQETKS